jgi:hypothetical protein
LGQQVQQAQVLLDQQDQRDQQVRQVDQLDLQDQQVQLELQVQLVLVDQQALKAQSAQQGPLLLFLAQLDQLDHKVLQLTLEDQLQLQQRSLQVATLPMTRTSLTLTVIFTCGTELPGRVLDRLLDLKGQ